MGYATCPPQDLGMNVQRMSHGVYSAMSGMQLGRLLVLEGESLAMGILINSDPRRKLRISIKLEASQMVARTSQGITEGQPRQTDGKQNKRKPATGKSNGKGKATQEDWHEFSFHEIVGASSQQLLFVMIPCMRLHGDYDLSLVEVEAEECDDFESGEARSKSHPFAPASISSVAVGALPECEDVGTSGSSDLLEDELLLAAISASLADATAGIKIADCDMNSEAVLATPHICKEDVVGSESDSDYELAVALSLAESPAQMLDTSSVSQEVHISELPSEVIQVKDTAQNADGARDKGLIDDELLGHQVRSSRRWNRHRKVDASS